MLKCNAPHSHFAFNFNLRRYIQVTEIDGIGQSGGEPGMGPGREVPGEYRMGWMGLVRIEAGVGPVTVKSKAGRRGRRVGVEGAGAGVEVEVEAGAGTVAAKAEVEGSQSAAGSAVLDHGGEESSGTASAERRRTVR